MQYFYQGFWIFIGIVAGIAVNFFTQKIINWRNEKNIIKNFEFEIDFNIKKINKFLEYLREFRDCINGDVLDKFAKYFDLSKAVFNTTNMMLFSGLLYKYLSNKNVENILSMISQFTIFWENLINGDINQFMNNFKYDKDNESKRTLSSPAIYIKYYSKVEATNKTTYWENFFKGHKENLLEIQHELKGSKK